MMKIRQLIILLITAFAATACSLIDDEVRPCPVEERDSDVFLSIQLDAAGSLTGSRTDGQHSEVDSEWRDFEDGIDFTDLGIFVFAKLANDEGSERLVFKTTDMQDDSVSILGGPGAYYVDLTLSKAHLQRIIKSALTEDIDNRVVFRIMMLANSGMSDWNNVVGPTFAEVITQLSNLTFEMSKVYDDKSQEGDVDETKDVTKFYRGNIPMFGTNTFTVSKNQLYYSREDQKVYGGELHLLRSLAKVRVVDQIANRDVTTGYPKILSASIVSSKNKAYVLPADAVRYENGQQVHTPNIFQKEEALSLSTAFTYNLGLISAGSVIPAEEGENGVVRAGYIPEQLIGIADNADGKGLPMFKVKVALSEDLIKEYSVPMTRYNDITFMFGTDILRNHIYTLAVTNVSAASLKLDVIVDPWVVRENDIEF